MAQSLEIPALQLQPEMVPGQYPAGSSAHVLPLAYSNLNSCVPAGLLVLCQAAHIVGKGLRQGRGKQQETSLGCCGPKRDKSQNYPFLQPPRLPSNLHASRTLHVLVKAQACSWLAGRACHQATCIW